MVAARVDSNKWINLPSNSHGSPIKKSERLVAHEFLSSLIYSHDLSLLWCSTNKTKWWQHKQRQNIMAFLIKGDIWNTDNTVPEIFTMHEDSSWRFFFKLWNQLSVGSIARIMNVSTASVLPTFPSVGNCCKGAFLYFINIVKTRILEDGFQITKMLCVSRFQKFICFFSGVLVLGPALFGLLWSFDEHGVPAFHIGTRIGGWKRIILSQLGGGTAWEILVGCQIAVWRSFSGIIQYSTQLVRECGVGWYFKNSATNMFVALVFNKDLIRKI